MGAFAIEFARGGHQVLYNDISPKMAELARNLAQEAGVEERIAWQVGPFQALQDLTQPFNLICCHAVLEWLAEPNDLWPFLDSHLAPGGFISLCCYNPEGLVFHNLLRGNFDWLDKSEALPKQKFIAHPGGLTPPNPPSFTEIKSAIDELQWDIKLVSGIRVFSDYVRQKTGGNTNDEAVLEKELVFSQREPFKWMGRYLHLVIQKPFIDA